MACVCLPVYVPLCVCQANARFYLHYFILTNADDDDNFEVRYATPLTGHIHHSFFLSTGLSSLHPVALAADRLLILIRWCMNSPVADLLGAAAQARAGGLHGGR